MRLHSTRPRPRPAFTRQILFSYAINTVQLWSYTIHDGARMQGDCAARSGGWRRLARQRVLPLRRKVRGRRAVDHVVRHLAGCVALRAAVVADTRQLVPRRAGEEEVDGREEHVLGLDHERPARPDDARGEQRQVLHAGELVDGAADVADACEHESPFERGGLRRRLVGGAGRGASPRDERSSSRVTESARHVRVTCTYPEMHGFWPCFAV